MEYLDKQLAYRLKNLTETFESAARVFFYNLSDSIELTELYPDDGLETIMMDVEDSHLYYLDAVKNLKEFDKILNQILQTRIKLGRETDVPFTVNVGQ